MLCLASPLLITDWAIELVGIECGLLYLGSLKNVSPQNGGFIRATEFARRLFVGKAKPIIFYYWIMCAIITG